MQDRYLQPQDIIKWVKEYNKGREPLNDVQVGSFVKELHQKVAQMNFGVGEGTTVMAYSGCSNGVPAWKWLGIVDLEQIEGKVIFKILEAPHSEEK